MLAKLAANRRERQILGVVARQPQPVARQAKIGQRRLQCGPQQPDRARVASGSGRQRPGPGRRFEFLLWQGLEPARGAFGIDKTLRKHGAQPGGQAAPAMEITKERLADAVADVEPIELRVQAVGQFTCHAGGVDSVARPGRARRDTEARNDPTPVPNPQRMRLRARDRRGEATAGSDRPRRRTAPDRRTHVRGSSRAPIGTGRARAPTPPNAIDRTGGSTRAPFSRGGFTRPRYRPITILKRTSNPPRSCSS